ncbi:hypothetical protein [Curtobacterium sp. Leaf261]|uniref:hypothetical protein n=1 Tax=Curtobacterium sp. Leaf261 TaxID=1736311 RepID=UPI000700ED50|nr:hypothetical protein [Curtobacterium sp. Leaf261]KQO61366.1 hypothetical protein ASF23_12875 [Curtobacterium sp. Leaf261]
MNTPLKLTVIAGLAFGLVAVPAAGAFAATPNTASQSTDVRSARQNAVASNVAQASALDPSKAPTVALIESWPLRGEASFSLSGQRVSGAEFVVEVNGRTQRIQSNTGGSFVFIKNFKQGQNTVTVTQQLDGVSTIAGTTTYDSAFNGSEYTDLTNPAIGVDPSRPIDPGFTAGPILADGFDKTKAPSVSLIERQGLTGASILVNGQDVKGTWFVVTANGTTSKIPVSNGMNFQFLRGLKFGDNVVTVTQESNGVQSPAGTLTIRVG